MNEKIEYTSDPPRRKPKNEKERVQRKRWIIEQIRSGVYQTDLAAELGVTRQAISAIWKDYQNRGDAVFERRRSGKPKESDTMTREEILEFAEWLKNNPPESIGFPETRWTLRAVKRAIVKKLEKRVRIEIAHAAYRTAFPLPEGTGQGAQLPPPTDGSAPAPAPAPALTAAQIAETFGPDFNPNSSGLPGLEEMEKINRETAPEFSPGESYASVAAPGVRTGKHSKGKRTPRQKPKRRKNR